MSNIDIKQTGESISKIRETRSGNVLIEVKRGNEAAGKVQREIEKSIDTNTRVRRIK